MNRASRSIPSCNDCKNEQSIFCCLSHDEKTNLSNNKGSNFYKKGQAIFYEGNQSHGLFCIFNGKVKLSKLGENGKEQIVRFAKTADILGYRSIFGNEPYQATATAIEDSHICHLSKKKFLELMKKNPTLSWSTMQLLSEDLKHAEKNLVNISQKSVKERIAESLLLLQTTFGFASDKKSLSVALSRSEIADMAGTTTETTIRTLAALKKDGLIELENKKIMIPNLSKLSNFAGIYD